MTQFGDFKPLCSSTPSFPWCNFFYRQLLRTSNTAVLTGPSTSPLTAGVGINPTCFIPPTFSSQDSSTSLGNIAHIIVCALSFFFITFLAFLSHQRKAAVGRIEMRSLLSIYAVSLPLSAISSGAFLKQGSTALVVITALHAGIVAAFFWGLLANALVSTQIVEDGTMSSLIPFFGISAIIFAVTTYLSLDTALGFTTAIGSLSDPPDALRSYSLFIILLIWPLLAVVVFFGLMAYIVLNVLHEKRPMAYYGLCAFLFLVSQIVWFLIGKALCEASNRKVDGIFLATVLETASIGVFYLGWRSITEDSWDEGNYFPT